MRRMLLWYLAHVGESLDTSMFSGRYPAERDLFVHVRDTLVSAGWLQHTIERHNQAR